jgi:hypothetical protein
MCQAVPALEDVGHPHGDETSFSAQQPCLSAAGPVGLTQDNKGLQNSPVCAAPDGSLVRRLMPVVFERHAGVSNGQEKGSTG